MDSLRLGLQAVILQDTPAARRYQRRQERLKARAWQEAVLSRMAERSVTRKDIASAIGISTGSLSSVLTAGLQLPNAWINPLSKLLGFTPLEMKQTWRRWPKLRPSIPRLTEQDRHARQVFQDLIAQRRMRQTDVAKAIGTNQSLISRALNGQRRMPHGWYTKIAELFGTSSDIFEID